MINLYNYVDYTKKPLTSSLSILKKNCHRITFNETSLLNPSLFYDSKFLTHRKFSSTTIYLILNWILLTSTKKNTLERRLL